MVNENRLPNPVPVSGAQVIQVVDAQQRVVGGSITADRLTPLLRPDELDRGSGRARRWWSTAYALGIGRAVAGARRDRR